VHLLGNVKLVIHSGVNSTACFGLTGHHRVDQEFFYIHGQPDEGPSDRNMLLN